MQRDGQAFDEGHQTVMMVDEHRELRSAVLDEDLVELDKELSAFFTLVMRARMRNPEIGMMSVLSAVATHGPVRLSKVAEHVGLDPSTVSRHVQNLERAGFLAKAADPTDRRAAKLHATDAGVARLQEAWRRRAAVIRDGLSHWAPEDLRLFKVLLERFADDVVK
ncbi:MarR family winged helix-turn-helix transcriptional regulator [Catenulispora rubra]|uniref:MarR family winged helix-turn-helix transcriptional regulator n=1 Tax=Catenulispora rubra TaxID=280293 RepID=UPI0018923D0A|nr:MarR family transcriptional regulator [Catenulispora rubra]